MSSTESVYQLKPVGGAGLWWSIIGIAAVLLLIPVGINAVVPAKVNNYEQLTVGAFGYDWEIPVVTESDAPVMCEMTSDDLFMKYWECNGDTTVITMMVEGVEDPANTLRRMVRAGLANPVADDIPVVASDDGRAHALVQPGIEQGAFVSLPIVAVSQRGTGEFEHLTAIAVVNGFSNEYYASHIWSSMAMERGLSYQQEFPLMIEEMTDPLRDNPLGELPWEELPWEEWLNEPGNSAPHGGDLNDLLGQVSTTQEEA